MSQRINGPVGSWRNKALNRPDDVTVIQKLLTAAAEATKNNAFDPRGVDGDIARPPRKSATVKAIRAFQSTFMRSPDGVVSPGKRTMQNLLKYGVAQPIKPDRSEAKPSSDNVFPLPFVPAASYKTGQRYFGARRSKGTRKHAGCDLLAPEGTKVYAVADGKIVRGPYGFYRGTYAIEVEHEDFVVRYCEIKRTAKGLKRGSKVTCGQEIATVGRMFHSSMLHLEMYKGTSSGRLTNRSNPPYQRRDDLLNPTTYLDKWKTNLPTT